MNKTEFKNKWEEVLKILPSKMETLKVETYVAPLVPRKVSDKDNTLIFSCENNEFFKSILSQKKNEEILSEAILSVFGKKYSIEIVDPSQVKDQPDSENSGDSLNATIQDSRLNPEYTFNTFVSGKTNNFALAASLAVADGYSKKYNPLFIYGGSGLGKTHLLHAIGQYVLQNKPKKKVLYVSSEMFTNELIFSIQNKSQEKFRSKYRKVDYLLFDDVQFIEGKASTEEELFHTFEDLYNAGKQIVFTSDKAPKDLGDIPDRLKSRFAWGMPVDIQTPDYETRMAILKNKAILDDIEIDDEFLEVLDVIAKNIQNNIRELEGAYNRVVTFSNLTGQKLSKELARNVLTEIFKTNATKITPYDVKDVVSKHFEIKKSDLESASRSKSIAVPRQIAIYLIRELCDISFPDIGELFGGRDHSTIIHSYKKIESEIKTDKILKEDIDSIKRNLENI